MQQQKEPAGKSRRVLGNLLVFLGGLALVGSAAAKLAHIPKVVSELGAMGFDGDKLMLIGALEVLSALLFLMPMTRAAGLLLVSAFMGGAIATHIQHQSSPVQPALVLSILWIGAWLRHPEVLWSAVGSLQASQIAPAELQQRTAGRV